MASSDGESGIQYRRPLLRERRKFWERLNPWSIHRLNLKNSDMNNNLLYFRGHLIDARFIIGFSPLIRTDGTTGVDGLGYTEMNFTLYLRGYSLYFGTKRYTALNSDNEERVKDMKDFHGEYWRLADQVTGRLNRSIFGRFRAWLLGESTARLFDRSASRTADRAETI
jgi:hypothetical protein